MREIVLISKGKIDRYPFLRNRVKHEIRMAKEKYYKDNISGNHKRIVQSGGKKLISLQEEISQITFPWPTLSSNL